MTAKRTSPIIIAAFGMLSASCGLFGKGGSPQPQQPAPPTPMPPPVRLYYDNGGGIRDSMRVVIRDRTALERRWQEATSPQATPPQTPTVMFDQEMVIVATAGRMTPEDEIHVDSLLVRRELNAQGQNEETLTVVVRTVVGCGRFRTEAFPLEIVKVRRFDGPVKWEERIQRRECGTPTVGS